MKLCCLIMADFLNIFAALEQGDCQTISCTILDRNDDVILLVTVACFMWKGLTFVNGYLEVTIPAYLSREFENGNTCSLVVNCLTRVFKVYVRLAV